MSKFNHLCKMTACDIDGVGTREKSTLQHVGRLVHIDSAGVNVAPVVMNVT
jgi:hypothetical protein